MTAQSKPYIKSRFETGDRPSQQDFVDFIDSYLDWQPALERVSTLVSGGGKGIPNFTNSSAAVLVSAGVVGLQVLACTTTAAAQAILNAATGDMLKSVYDPLGINEQLIGVSAAQSLFAKTFSSPVINGTVTGTALLTPVNGPSVASTTGTAIAFTGIPAGAKQVTVNFSGVSTNGTSGYRIQLGTSLGLQTTGYNACGSSYISGVAPVVNNSVATGFSILTTGAADSLSGSAIFTLVDAATGTWVLNCVMAYAGGALYISGGGKSLSGMLDRVSILTMNGTDTFDAGLINIQYQ